MDPSRKVTPGSSPIPAPRKVRYPVNGRLGGGMRARSGVERAKHTLTKVPSEGAIHVRTKSAQKDFRFGGAADLRSASYDGVLGSNRDDEDSVPVGLESECTLDLASASSSFNSSSWSLSNKSHDMEEQEELTERRTSVLGKLGLNSRLSHCASVPALPVCCDGESPLLECNDSFLVQRSIGSETSHVSVLQPITTKQARQRSFLLGSVGCHGALLGEAEMIRYFPDKRINVLVGTWNMNGQGPPESIDDFLLPEDVEYVPDMYAIGVQEGTQDWKEWEITLQATIGASHILFHSVSLGVLHLAIFIRRDLMWFCSVPEENAYPTRSGSMVKTKGAVAIAFLFFGTSFLFVNCHLTAHEKKLKERIADYEKIRTMLDLPKQIPLKPQYISKDVTARFDCVFWCGDLNFRLVRDRESVLSFLCDNRDLSTQSYSQLIKYDQLRKTMKDGIAFCHFQEGKIHFAPSYKFDKGTNDYDTIKNRVPSYTDRILFRNKKRGSVECLNYNSVPNICTSDHKPVYATFRVKIKAGRDNIPLAAGLFKRDVYLEELLKNPPLGAATGTRRAVVISLFPAYQSRGEVQSLKTSDLAGEVLSALSCDLHAASLFLFCVSISPPLPSSDVCLLHNYNQTNRGGKKCLVLLFTMTSHWYK